VAITAGCDAVEPWAAICIGVIAAFVYTFFSKFILAMNIDDPLEASSVHYANGVWGILSCIIFDSSKGFVSGNPAMGEYLGVQAYGVICITLWGIVMSCLFFGLFSFFGILRYHPVLEMVGAHRLKMGDISEKWLKEIRSIAKEKAQDDIEGNKLGEVLDYDAQIDQYNSGSLKEGKS
jgi:Amt family ammonium transporter